MSARPAEATTAALLTPPGRGGIAVIGLEGPRAWTLATALFRPPLDKDWPVGRLKLGELHDADGRIDEALLLRQGPCRVELNIHGGPAAARETLSALADAGAVIGTVAADPAFLQPHPDWANPAITRELLTALPAARTPRVAEWLARQWSAGLSQLAAETIRAAGAGQQTGRHRADLAAALAAAGERFTQAAGLLNPPEVVLIGPPNAGKSQLANALLGRAACIVHETAGTTRDWLRELAALRGRPVWLTDTAGIWPSEAHAADDIDRQAVQRGRQRALTADLVVLIGAGQMPPRPDWLADAPVLLASSQADRVAPFAEAELSVSAASGLGLDRLSEVILARLGLLDMELAAPAAFTARQAEACRRAAEALDAGSVQAARIALADLLGRPT